VVERDGAAGHGEHQVDGASPHQRPSPAAKTPSDASSRRPAERRLDGTVKSRAA
jgi:hypothetical protein